ncbi:MAG: hypothetical protein Q9162_001621 [Coniocarpon cinnabarinum]
MNPRKRTADDLEAAWLADEDAFVLRQAYKKAQIRTQEGRAKPIDRLAVTIQFIDDTRHSFDHEVSEAKLEPVDPLSYLESLEDGLLKDLDKDMDVFMSLIRVETTAIKKEFWHGVRAVCRDLLQNHDKAARGAANSTSVSQDAFKIFRSKTIDELTVLEDQIRAKLSSGQPVDSDYWQSLLSGATLAKSREQLKTTGMQIIAARNGKRILHQARIANGKAKQLENTPRMEIRTALCSKELQSQLDPEPLLKIPRSCQTLPLVDEDVWLRRVARERDHVIKTGHISEEMRKNAPGVRKIGGGDKANSASPTPAREHGSKDDALFAQEAAKDAAEDEEVFSEEADLPVDPGKASSIELRKPRYFNRVLMGYEWNKYNQTHYDHDHPPPKVVQGYKFNIFYPDLLNKPRGPTYKILRDKNRRRGEASTHNGEDDTCIIRFLADPPYQDLAFRIIDREWDYSAKHERGFKSTFEGGVLQLHFQFRRMFYRK